jgi:ABC-2 type transport system permease protein
MHHDLAVVRTQSRYALVAQLRNPRTLVFSVIFPIILLVMFNAIFSSGATKTIALAGGRIAKDAYFTAGIAAYSIALAAFTSLLIGVTTQRESAQLKRLRGTPMPTWTFMAAQLSRALLQSAAMVVALFAIGVVAFSVEVHAAAIVGIVVYVVLGVAVMAALALALSPFTPTPDVASSIGPFAIVMLSFVSGVFISVDNLPSWLESIGKVFPLYHLAHGLQTCLVNGQTGTGLDRGDLVNLLIWGALGANLARRRFRWEPLGRG